MAFFSCRVVPSVHPPVEVRQLASSGTYLPGVGKTAIMGVHGTARRRIF
jgi:hypothetical protein